MEEEDEYLIPLQDQRVFGAGIKRKRIQFVPADTSPSPLPQPLTTTNAGQRYLSIVLGSASTQTDKTASIQQAPDIQTDSVSQEIAATPQDARCEICNLPIPSLIDDSKPHETSLVHQFCLARSHPPSHLDRTRTGLKYLSSYGWDPDSRLGLGAKGEGVRVPIKAKPKNNTVGLGVGRAISKRQPVAKKVERLDAKGVRRRELEVKKRGERLQQMFYGRDDVERYLGVGS